ncbi:hypothetical protein ACRUMN_07685 [Kluyvera cryocrescens]|uniref:hypothetical protein n=1 Tax=Kluyvera cryocrescens TaxID=580 RepID=UPI003D7FC775
MLRIGQVESSATADGTYTDGNVAGGISATRLRASAFNAIQEELAHVVESTGVDLDVDDTTQVLTALKAMFAANTESMGALAALVGAANKLPYFTGADEAALADLTAFAREILAQTNAAGVLSKLGLGGAAELDVGTTSGTVAAGDDSRIVNAVQTSSPTLCTAWVNFRGDSPATIRSSHNVSSVTRLSAGKYQINFGTPMNNANYVPALTIGDSASSGSASAVVTLTGSTTGDPVKKDVDGINITTRGSSGAFDYSEINAIFFGGK